MELKTTIIQASIRGDKHETIPNQDYINVFENDEFLITTVSDGYKNFNFRLNFNSSIIR